MELNKRFLRVCPTCYSVYDPGTRHCPRDGCGLQPISELTECNKLKVAMPNLLLGGFLLLACTLGHAGGASLVMVIATTVFLVWISFRQCERMAQTVRDRAEAFILQKAEERDKALKIVADFLSDFNAQSALDALENAKRKGFDGYDFDTLRATSLHQLGRFKEAIPILERIIIANGNTYEAVRMLALSYMNVGHADAHALRRLEDLISGLAAPERNDLLAFLVRSGKVARRYDSAYHTVIRLAFAEMPDDADVIHAAAEYARADGNLEQAIACLRTLPVEQHSLESLALWATSLAALNHMDPEAEIVYSRYLDENPSDMVVRVTLGNILIREQRHEEAERLYQAGIELDPYNARLWYNLALTHMQAGRYENAIGALQSFMKTDCWDSYRSKGDVHRIMGICMMRQGMLSQALKQLQMSDRSMQTLNRLYELGGMFELQGDLQAALACYGEIYAEDITYRDVAERIRAVRIDAPERQAPQ